MVSSSTLRKNKLTLISEKDPFQNIYSFLSYFRISSKKSVDITIQQMVKFDVLSASFIFLLTLFYSFKSRYKDETYSFLIGQNLPGVTNLSQKTFKETLQYVLPSQAESYLVESQFHFDKNFVEQSLTDFYQNETIKFRKNRVGAFGENFPHFHQKQTHEDLIFNGKTLSNLYHLNILFNKKSLNFVKDYNTFKKQNKFTPSIYNQSKLFGQNKTQTLYAKGKANSFSATPIKASDLNLLSPYSLTFQSFPTQSFVLSTVKKIEKEGTSFKISELPLNSDFYFGVFQKKDELMRSQNLDKKDFSPRFGEKSTKVKQNIFRFPQEKIFSLHGKTGNKNKPFLTKIREQDWVKIYKQNKITAPNLFQKDQKDWFSLGQNKLLEGNDIPAEWSSFYKNNLSKKDWGKWKKGTYQRYLQLDQFPLKLGSVMSSETSNLDLLTSQFDTKTEETLPKNVVKTRDEVSNSFQNTSKSFLLKHKFLLRGSKAVLNLDELEFTERNYLNLETNAKPFCKITHKNNGFNKAQSRDSDQKFDLLKENQTKTLSELNPTNCQAFKPVGGNVPMYEAPLKLTLLKNQIKGILSSSKNDLDFRDEKRNTFDLLFNKPLISLNEILSNLEFSSFETGDTFFDFLPQKKCFTNSRDRDLTNLSTNSNTQEKEKLELQSTKKFNQYFQAFWSENKEPSFQDISDGKDDEKIKDNHNWFPVFVKYLSRQPRLMSGYKFPDLNEKEIGKSIKYSNPRENAINRLNFVKEMSFFLNNLKKEAVFTLKNDSGLHQSAPQLALYAIPLQRKEDFLQSLKRDICQEYPVDVYLPSRYTQRFPQGLSFIPQIRRTPLLENHNLIKQTKDLRKPGGFNFDHAEIRVSQRKSHQNRTLGLNFDKENPCLKSLKFVSKPLKIENSTEKQFFFEDQIGNNKENQSFKTDQIPGLLKTSSIWNPKLQKLQIAKTLNNSEYTAPSIDFLKNLFSSTNFLTDRKQRFFALGAQLRKEQESSFLQRPFSGIFFGLSSKPSPLWAEKASTQSIEKAFHENKYRDNSLIKKDFSILPLFLKTNQEGKERQPSVQRKERISSQTGLKAALLGKDSEGGLQETNQTEKVVLAKSSNIYPKSFKPITKTNFCSFFDISAFHPIGTANLHLKSNEIFIDFTPNTSTFDKLFLTKKLVDTSKLNVKRKQLSDKCDKQSNGLHLPPTQSDLTYFQKLTSWLSSRYKKPSITYSFQKKVFHLPSTKRMELILEQKNRYENNKWGEIEQQEDYLKKPEEGKVPSFSEQVFLPLTTRRSLHLPNTSKILQTKEFSFFTKKPLLSEPHKKESKIVDTNLEKRNLNGNDILSHKITQILPQKKLSFVPKNLELQHFSRQVIKENHNFENKKQPFSKLPLSVKEITKNDSHFFAKGKRLIPQKAPVSYFLSDVAQKGTSLSYLKRLDTNCDRLDWQLNEWHPFSQERYTYLPPSQATLNEHFLKSFLKNKLKKRNTIYKYNRSLPFLKFNYVKSSNLNSLLPNLCWEPITIKSWMVITQYCYAFFLVRSGLYVYEKHMKKVLLSFAPLLSGRGIVSGMPSFGEYLENFLGESKIDKNVLLFKKVPKRFQDIVAIDNKLPQLSEIVWFLRNFGRTVLHTKHGEGNVSKIQGVLFVGPPGTGKTLLVQSIAGEAEVPVLVLSGSSFADGKKNKKGGQLLKKVFQRARVLAPSILFIDEIDTLGESRSHFAQDERDQKNESSRIIESISYTGGKIQDKTAFSQNTKNNSVKQVGLLTQFLVEMDGLARQEKSSNFLKNKTPFRKSGGILVIGSTNRPKVLDPALIRPGRFNQVFYLANPGKQKRIEILKAYTKNIGVSSSLPWDYLGDRTLGFSAADLSALVNKSTIRAILSHTIHTIQSIEEGIESLPKFSQNQNKSSILEKKNISTSFLPLESRKSHNKNLLICKSIFDSLAICTKYVDLQGKYKSFNFYIDPMPSPGRTLESKPDSFKELKKPLQQSVSDFNLQENKRDAKFDFSLGLDFPFLSKLPFYQAGKVMVQVLVSCASHKGVEHPENPITLVATLWPKQELSFSSMVKESINSREVVNRQQFETRLINGYAGKAAETLVLSGLQFYKDQSATYQSLTRVTWQSTLGVEDWKSTNALASSMISKYYFYSQRIATERENLIALVQNSNEISETGNISQAPFANTNTTNSEMSGLPKGKSDKNFQLLENIFFKEEFNFSPEKDYSSQYSYKLKLLPKGQMSAENRGGENKLLLNPINWVSNLYQQYETNKIFGHIEENNWYQIYLPPLVKDEQNKEWVPLDQYYFGRENLVELLWNKSKNKSVNWSDIYKLNQNITYQGLILYHFNKALSLLDTNRELLDLFANLLLSFRTIRKHEILKILSYFKHYTLNF